MTRLAQGRRGTLLSPAGPVEGPVNSSRCHRGPLSRFFRRTAAASLILAATCSLPVLSQTSYLTIYPSFDTTLSRERPESSFATDNTLIINMKTNPPDPPVGQGYSWQTKAALIHFDLSPLVGMNVISATFYFTTAEGGYHEYGTWNATRVLPANSGWTSGCTWNMANPAQGISWAGDAARDGGPDAGCSVSGTDISATVMASSNVGNIDMPVNRVITMPVINVAELEAVVDNNYGILFWSDHRGGTVHSMEATTQSYRPRLVCMVYPKDPTPPAAVNNLAAAPGTPQKSVRLSWTAPGDDGTAGVLNNASFLIQYSTWSGAAWSAASAQVTVSTNGVNPGSPQARNVTGLLGGVTYYFRIWTRDDAGNTSAQSNMASAFASNSSPEAPTNVRTNGAVDPVGTLVNPPVFSWTFRDDDPYDGQTACQVILANNINDVNNSSGSVWDSGKILTTASSLTYGGPALTKGVQYYWRVRLWDRGDLVGPYSAVGSFSLGDNTPPGTVADLAGTTGVNAGTVNLVWTAPGDDGTAGVIMGGAFYIQYQFTIPGTIPWSTGTAQVRISTSNVVPGSLRQVTVTGLTQGSSYLFRLWTRDALNNWSAPSNITTATARVDNTPPGAVTDLVGINSAEGTVDLTWTCPGDDGYTGALQQLGRFALQYSSNPAASWNPSNAQINVSTSLVPGAARAWKFTGLANNASWYFRVWYGDEVPNWSAPSSVTVFLVWDTIPPAKVTNLAYASGGAGVAVLTWTAPGDNGTEGALTGFYRIQYSTNLPRMGIRSQAQISFSTFNVTPGSTARYEIPGLNPSLTYYFVLWACDEVGNWSPRSNITSTNPGFSTADVTPPFPPSEVRAELLAQPTTAQTALISWRWSGDNGSAGAFTPFGVYYLQYSLNPNTAWSHEQAQITGVSYNVPALSTAAIVIGQLFFDATYYLRMWVADDVLNVSSGSAVFTLSTAYNKESVDTTPPARITDLSASANEAPDSVMLSWTAPGDDGTIGTLPVGSLYRIQYSTEVVAWSTGAAQITMPTGGFPPGTRLSYVINGLQSGVTQYIVIWTFDGKQNWSPVSAPPAFCITQDTIAPAAVVDPRVELTAVPGQVRFSFDYTGDNSTSGYLAKGYIRVQHTTDVAAVEWSTANAQVVLSTGGVSPGQRMSFIIAGLEQERRHYFRVWLGDEVINWSGPSPVVNAYVPLPETVPPARVTDLVAAMEGYTSARLTWTMPGDDGWVGDIANGTVIIKYSRMTDVNDGTWDSIPTQVLFTTNAAPGTPMSVVVHFGPGDAFYSVALKVSDEQGNWSPVSNQVNVVTRRVDTNPPLVTPLLTPPAAVGILRNRITALMQIVDDSTAPVTGFMRYRVNDEGWRTVPPTSVIGGTYRFDIPPEASAQECTLSWQVEARDAGGNFAYYPSSIPAVIAVSPLTRFAGNAGTFSVPDGNPEDGVVRVRLAQGTIGVPEFTVEQGTLYDSLISFTLGPALTPVDRPFDLTLMYLDTDNDGIVDGTGVPATTLAVHYRDPATNAWRYIGGVVDTSTDAVTGKTISVRVNRFGIYGLRAGGAPVEDTPGPDRRFLTPGGSGVAFSASVREVMVTTVNGVAVVGLRREGGSRIVWDGRAHDGSPVESGLYLCRMTMDDDTVKYTSIVVAK